MTRKKGAAGCDPDGSTSSDLSKGASGIVPDASQVEAQRARTLLELAGAYTRVALNFPTEIDTLRVLVANLMLEVAMLRAQVEQLQRGTEADQ